MTIEEAKILYDKHEGKNSFATHAARCLFAGSLIKRGEFLIMGEPIYTDGKRVWWKSGKKSLTPRNCYWIYYAVAPEGKTSICDFMSEAPHPLPYVAFKRRGKIKIYRWEKLKRSFYANSEHVSVH